MWFVKLKHFRLSPLEGLFIVYWQNSILKIPIQLFHKAFKKALIISWLIYNDNTLLHKLYKKTQIQYDVPIESCTGCLFGWKIGFFTKFVHCTGF